MPDSAELWDRVDKVVRKYRDAKDRTAPDRALYLANFETIHESTKSLCREGLLGDPTCENMYFLVSDDGENPKFVTKRGSSQLEALWRAMEAICTGPDRKSVV